MALKHWRPLAKQGNSYVQWRLGRMYQYGKGVIRDYREARRWYRKAALVSDGIVNRTWSEPDWRLAEADFANLKSELRRKGNWPPRSRQASKPPVTARKTP